MVVKQFWMSSEVLGDVASRPRLTQIGWWNVVFTALYHRVSLLKLMRLCISDKSVVHGVFIHHVEAFHHTQSILLYGQAARAISIG